MYWGRRLAELGAGTRIDEGVHIVGPEHVRIGRNCWIAANVFLGAGPPSLEHRHVVRRPNADFRGAEGELLIADHAYLAPQVLINGHGGVEIGPNAAVSTGAKVFSSSHHYREHDGSAGRPAFGSGTRRGAGPGEQALLVGPVKIGEEAFVGANAVVMPGVTIGARTWLGAGAVARRTLEPGRVYSAPDPVAVPTEESRHGGVRAAGGTGPPG